jgi:hypothetical protein
MNLSRKTLLHENYAANPANLKMVCPLTEPIKSKSISLEIYFRMVDHEIAYL